MWLGPQRKRPNASEKFQCARVTAPMQGADKCHRLTQAFDLGYILSALQPTEAVSPSDQRRASAAITFAYRSLAPALILTSCDAPPATSALFTGPFNNSRRRLVNSVGV